MRTFTLCFVLVALLGLTTSGLAEIVTVQPCSDPEVNVTNSCIVHSVDVRPCAEAARRKPCRIRSGRRASISFDFTPDFSGSDLETSAYWVSGAGDIPFSGMNHNACNSTACPAIAGTRQTYDYGIELSSSFPKGVYNVKWKVWNTEQKECCFVFKIKLTR